MLCWLGWEDAKVASPVDDFRQKLANRGFVPQESAPTAGINFFNLATGGNPFPTEPANDQSTGSARAQILGGITSASQGMASTALGDSAASTLAKSAAAPPAAAIAALDLGQRVVNTGIGGSILAFGDYAPWNIALRKLSGNDTMLNPLYRDGFQWSDIPDSYRKTFGNQIPVVGANGLPVKDDDGNVVYEVDAITGGQAITAIGGRTGINVMDTILPTDLQANLDKAIEEDTVRAINDPLNERGLFSWMSGLHSEFNIYNRQERESAFNQGLGRWVSGTADAAVMWWAAPEVIGLKAAGLAGRSLFLRSIDELGDIEKARESINLHKMWMDGVEGGRQTDFGRLMESLAKMSRTQVARHQIAKNSTDVALVARTFGDAKTFDEVSDRFLAMSGDMAAIDRLFATDKVLSDTFRMNLERLAEVREQIDDLSMLGKVDGTRFFDQFINRYQIQADRLTGVIDDAVKENKQLESALAGLNREAGLPDAVRFGEVQLSRLKFGPNSVARMEEKAIQAANRAEGKHLWRTDEFKTGGSFGRTVRVWQSAYDYMRTNRIRGFARLTDSNDVIAEIDASIDTLPMFRRLQKQYQGQALLPGTDKLVSEFRAEMYDRMIGARTATERQVVLQDYERQVFKALSAEYNVDPEVAGQILTKYQGLRQVVIEVAKAKGLVIDGGEVNIVPEFQALLAEGMPVMDFHFMEQILRLERGTGIGVTKDRWNLRGSRGFAAFDAVWRPLVLMRLGYTARNVAEGGLRELAAFGTLGSMYQLGEGTRAVAGNPLARWAAGVGRGMDRIGSMRYGRLKSVRNNLQSAQSLARMNRKKVEELRFRQDETGGRLTARADAADVMARNQILREMKERLLARVGYTWEQVTTEQLGEMDLIMREATEIIVPVEYVRPLFGGAGRRANVVSGFDDAETAQMRVVNEAGARRAQANVDQAFVDADPLSPDSAYAPVFAGEDVAGQSGINRFLNAEERDQWAELEGLSASTGLQPWQAELYGELQDRAAARALRKAMRDGDYVVRIVDPSSGLYQRVHSTTDVLLDDVVNGNLGILPKETVDQVQYVRANVAGAVYDLRVPPAKLPTAAGRGDLGVKLDEDGEAFFDGDLDQLNDYLTGLGFDPLTTKNQWKQAKALLQADSLVRLVESDPTIAEALALRQMVQGLPESMRAAFEDSGLLLTNQKLRRMMRSLRDESRTLDEIKAESDALYRQMVDKYTDDPHWQQLEKDLGGKVIYHTGPNIESGVIAPDPINTPENLTNLMSIGLYGTRDGQTSTGYFFTRVLEGNTGEARIYAIPLKKKDESRYLNVDQVMTQDLEDTLRGVFDDMWESAFGAKATDEQWALVDEILREDVIDSMFPLSPTASVRGDGKERISDFMFAMKGAIAREMESNGTEWNQALYDSAMTWVNAVRKRGFVGLRHRGGRNQPNFYTDEERLHDVFVIYGDGTADGVPKLIPLEDLSAEMVAYQNLQSRLGDVQARVAGLDERVSGLERLSPWEPTSLNAAYMSMSHMKILTDVMKSHGIGRVLIDDAYSPSGYQVLTSPDMISVSTDQVDAMLPSGLIGKDFVDNTLPILEREALVRNPAVLQPGDLSNGDLMGMFDNNQGVVNVIRGLKEGTPYERAVLARGLEVNGYTHVQIGGADSNKFTNVSELVGNRQTGSAYGAMIGADEVAQRRNLILANDEKFAELEAQWGELERMIKDADEVFLASEERAKAAADALTKRLGKRASGKTQKAPLGSGIEAFSGNFNPFEMPGPFSAANQGSLNASLASSGQTVMANLYGFTDYAQMALRKSMVQDVFTPGSSDYFRVMAEQVNRYWRNDLIGMAVIRGDSDEQIMKSLFGTKQGRAYIRDVEGYGQFKGYINSGRLSDDARADLSQKIVDVRNAFHKLIPDEELRKHLIDNEVTSDYLMSQLGWRTDLANVTGGQLVDSGLGTFRKMTGAVMHVLGTLPENAAIRHPFYRARWREEMQRQADLYASQGVQEFSQAQLNAMNQVAKKWALKQTNETLYTIQRLSTPAHMFKFVMPFFPAWASSMRFWLLRMPVEQPQNVARYAMLYNAPESAGWVYDEEGNKVVGKESGFEKLVDKAFGRDRGDIVIRAENETIRKVTAALTGGQDQVRLSKASLDVMLQGETFWFPGLHVFFSIPATWLAAQRPDIATAIETGNLKEIPFLGELIPEAIEDLAKSTGMSERAYRAVVPFGTPTKEKDILDVVLEQITPGIAKRIITGVRGMDSAEFANAAKEIHRFAMTEWDLSGREGKEPEFLDAVNQAKTFSGFRAVLNAVLPFTTRFQSRYQFYIDEARRIDRETFDNGGTYDDANSEFLRLYGPVFFRYTQSLSAGGSGMSATVGEFREFERDPRLMAQLADIGTDASFITMATRPFAKAMNEGGFDNAVYAWQMNRMVEGTSGKYLRGGVTTELPENRSQRELGWMEFEKVMESLNALAASRGTTVEASPNITAAKQEYAAKIGARYPAWYEDYKEIGGNRYIRSNMALEAMVERGYFEAHKDHPYAKALLAFYEGRKSFVAELQRRKAAGLSGSLDANSNASLKAYYLEWVEQLRSMDSTGNFGNTWERFFQSDPLQPIPVLEVSNG